MNMTSNKDFNKFLNAMLPRTGKSLVVLHFCRENNLKNVLFITAKCDALISISDDWRKFFCESYKFISKQDILAISDEDIKNNRTILDNDENHFVAVSMQSTARGIKVDDEELDMEINENDTENSKLLERLSKQTWDAIIIDECHFAIGTKRSTTTLKRLLKNSPNCFKIEISATPYEKLTSGEYTVENSFIYDAYSEAMDPNNREAKEKKDYSKYVPFVNFHLDLCGSWLSNLTITELNGTGRTSKKTNDARKAYINERLSAYCSSASSPVYSWESFFEDSIYGFNTDSISWMMEALFKNVFFKLAINAKTFAIYVKEIKQGEKLEQALSRLDKFTVINVCGSKRTSVYEVNNKLKKSVEDENEKPVVIISCGRYLTATTLKYLDSFIFMGKCNSPENYNQFSARAKNTYPNRKCPCYVFDLNTEATLCSKNYLDTILIQKERYERKPIEKLAKEYLGECLEVWEIINEHDVKKIDVIEEMHNTFCKAGIFKSKDMIQNVIGIGKLKALAQSTNMHDLLADASGKGIALLQLTPQQIAKNSKKTTKKKNSNNEGSKDTHVSDIDKFLNVCEQTVLMMHTYSFSELDEVIQSDEMKKCWYVHTHADPELFEKIKEWSKQNDDSFLWEKFCCWFAEESKRLKKIFEAA